LSRSPVEVPILVPDSVGLVGATGSGGLRTGNWRSSRVSMRLKIGVFAAIPRASERIATAVNAGLLASMRAP
jgi:hypothetical protein